MKYNKAKLLVLRAHGSNAISSVMGPRSGKYPKLIWSNASNLIIVPITPSNDAA